MFTNRECIYVKYAIFDHVYFDPTSNSEQTDKLYNKSDLE